MSKGSLFPALAYRNDNVLDCQNVNQLAACWHSRSGDSAFLAGVPDTAQRLKDCACDQECGAHPHYVDRLTLRVSAGLELAMPFDLAINTGSADLPGLHVCSIQRNGHTKGSAGRNFARRGANGVSERHFHADAFPITAIRFDLDNPTPRLQPRAIYANIPERVYLDTRYVSYRFALGVAPPVVSLDVNGVVHGPGTAMIRARFGSFSDQVRVNVEAEQQ